MIASVHVQGRQLRYTHLIIFTEAVLKRTLYVLTLFRPDTLYVNSADTVQMPHFAASEQCLHCLFTEIFLWNIK